MDIKIIPNSRTPIYMQVKNQIREMIIKGKMDHIDFLPSERKLAEEVGIHRNTVIRAYHELMADGLISASRGKGYKIIHAPSASASLGEAAKKKGAGIGWEFLVKDAFKFTPNTFNRLVARSYDKNLISFAGGILSPEASYREDVKLTLEKILSSGREDIYKYAPYQGLYSLRKNASIFLKDRGINAKPSEVQIFADTNHAVEYLLELFVSPGDSVFVEEPASPEIYYTLKLSGARIITIPLTPEGIDIHTIETLVSSYKPKLIFTSASFNDPTGITASIKTRKGLLEISAKYKVPIIEEDAASEIFFSDQNVCATKALDKNENVIYIYSYALTFPPGFKTAFVVGPREIVKRLSYLISIRIVSVDSLTQALVSEFLKNGMYKKNLLLIRELFKEKRDVMCEGLEEAKKLGLQFTKPEGGVYLWCKLPENTDPIKLAYKAGERGVAFMPGDLFFLHGTEGSNFIRLNYSYPSIEQIKKGVLSLSQALRESL